METENVQVVDNETQSVTKTTSSKKEKVIFWSRMVGWALSGVVAPIVTFAVKFGLFTETGYTITTDELGNVTATATALNGWGIISILIVAFAAMQVIKEVIAAQGTGYTLSKQVLHGFKSRILPLAIALGISYYLQGVIADVVFCLFIILITQVVAIVVNPLPEWRAKKNKEEDYNDVMSGLVKAIKEFSKKEGKK